MSKAAAKRELMALVGSVKPWETFTEAQQAEVDRLKAIAFPNGIPLPRI
ncbi:hypothetical protein Jolie1_078 [Mycobacterium phage Julie1]|jgi:hypothetical protein|uniref:Uncharacterized protein n=1 Tax=Mycobacterium phage Julie1 TaxID=1463812 RepID=W8EK25_9CAUD|nr:hypothetical protein CG90_gp78 [Mycobacterium phage Julie1]AHJ88578.1 hypothetical protein Jolie1_078 [Mycobacterium phage Julie1]